MFIAALFIIAKKWKQPECPLTDEEDMVYIHNRILLRYKELNNAIFSKKDTLRDYHGKSDGD